MTTKKWQIYSRKSADIIEQLLINRKINLKDKESFLNPDYEKDLHDPFLFKDMKKAVKRIKQAMEKKEKIGLFADYDADGIPGAALLYRVFYSLGLKVEVYIPSREEGYGLNEQGIRELSLSECKLIITVDLGIVNHKEVKSAKKLGLDVIITDHHEIQKDHLPKEATAILYPRLLGQKYPNKDLAGGGVAWKLAQGILMSLARQCSPRTDLKIPSEDFGSQRSSSSFNHATRSARCSSQTPASPLLSKDKRYAISDKQLKWLLDLATISTICDIVPLKGENRTIAKYGLIVLSKTKNLGLQKLYQVAGIKPEFIGTYTVGFQIGPRINAPGRIDHAAAAFRLLTTDDESEALKIANQLNKINQKRQEELERVLTAARKKVQKKKLHKKKVILVEGKDWPEGIIGLVAGKLMEEFSRPVLVLKQEKKGLKGSARSIEQFHLIEALDQAKKYLSKHGGHARAAGFSLENKHLSNLYDKLLEIAEAKLKFEDLVPKISIDAEITPEQINMELYNLLQKFEPHGLGNPRPVFLMKGLVIDNKRPVGKDARHIKLTLSSNVYRLTSFDAIGFDMGYLDKELKINDTVDIVFTLDLNEYNGNKKLQLKLLDIKKGGGERELVL